MPLRRLGGAPGWALRGLGILALALGFARAALAVYFAAEVPEVAPSTESGPPLTRRVLLIVIDGLRADTALESGWMPRLSELARRGASGVALAPQVTMTSTGVRALGSGVSPGMADLVRYGALPPVPWDSVPAQVARRGGRVALVGDAAWREAFGPHIAIDQHDTGFVEAFHAINNVYGADAIWVPRAVELARRDDWQLAIVMLGGVDHASHRFTPFGAPFRDKIAMTDRDIARIVEAAGDDVTVIVTSDHGAGDRGHHGSGEPEARRTPLVLAGKGIVPGARIAARQIDVAATVATLLGLPLPAASEGRVILDALAVSGDERTAIEARNRRQLARLAEAYATARRTTPPHDPDAIAEWLEQARARASAAPMLWALALVLVAVGLMVGNGERPAPIVPWALAIGAGAGALLLDGGAAWIAIAALVAAASGLADDLVAAQRPAKRRAAIGIGLLLAVEGVVALWRLNVRVVELWQLAAAERIRQSPELVAALAALLVGLAIAPWLRLRRGAMEHLGPWGALLVIAALAALGDALALPSAIVAGAVATVAWAPRRELPSLLAGLAAGAFGIAWVGHHALTRVDLTWGAPLLLALGAIAVLPQRRPFAIATLLAIALGGIAVRATGGAPFAVALLLLGGTASLLFGARGDGGAELLGFGAAELLLFLSHSDQVPGLFAWTIFAFVAGRIVTVEHGRPAAILVAALACLAARHGCFAVLEGAFRLSRIEVEVGYAGNPGTDHLIGGALVAGKFLLPYVVAIALGTARFAAADRARVLAACAAFHLLRVGHVVLSMTITRGTFYSPYLDAGHLLFQLALIGSLMIVALPSLKDGLEFTRRRR